MSKQTCLRSEVEINDTKKHTIKLKKLKNTKLS